MVRNERPDELQEELTRSVSGGSILDSYKEPASSEHSDDNSDPGSPLWTKEPIAPSAPWIKQDLQHFDAGERYIVLARERRAHWKQVCSPGAARSWDHPQATQHDNFPERQSPVARSRDSLLDAGSSKKLLPTSPSRSGMAGIRHRVSAAIVSVSSSFTLRTRTRAADAPVPDRQYLPNALGRSWSGPSSPVMRSSQLPFFARTPTATSQRNAPSTNDGKGTPREASGSWRQKPAHPQGRFEYKWK
ncbi:hypothetical protein T484DRAFT_1849927 [Baffinella frigidus]|nr:hypothetical protein T484DRAFT_1849927 [Cryptophyta sp. CCMP2293]